MRARAWLRLVRPRFLLASVVAACAGLAVHWREAGGVDAPAAAVTLAGVVLLHASVDVLNDYWDHRRGIDLPGPRSGISGGTGVLPEGLLDPRDVRRAGLGLLAAGSAAGAYLAATSGPLVAALLAFAAASVYFYSTRIVDSGLAEAFVAAKGASIVVGAAYVQGGEAYPGAVLAGAALGSLSALVLFAASFPDREADRRGGRRTLAMSAGPARAAAVFWGLVAAAHAALLAGAASGELPPASLAFAAPLPLAASAWSRLRGGLSDPAALPAAASRAAAYARASGALLAAGVAAGAAWP